MKDLRPASHADLESPFGLLSVAATDQGLACVEFSVEESLESWLARHQLRLDPTAGQGPLKQALDELDAYCREKLTQFSVELDYREGTLFQQEVWREAARIPFGQSVTYGELAGRIGRPLAQRPVGGALGRNPIPIIVPCHRILASGGRLGGFSAGLPVKRKLLAHEGFLLDLGLDVAGQSS